MAKRDLGRFRLLSGGRRGSDIALMIEILRDLVYQDHIIFISISILMLVLVLISILKLIFT